MEFAIEHPTCCDSDIPVSQPDDAISNNQEHVRMENRNDEGTQNQTAISDPTPSTSTQRNLTEELLAECFQEALIRGIDMSGWAYGFGQDKGLQDYEVYKDCPNADEVTDQETNKRNVSVVNNVVNYYGQKLKGYEHETETELEDYLNPWDLEEMETKAHYLGNDEDGGDKILEQLLLSDYTEIPYPKRTPTLSKGVPGSENAPPVDSVHKLRFETNSSKTIKETTDIICNKMDWDWRDGVGKSQGTLSKSDYDILSCHGSGWIDPNERVVHKPKAPPIIIKPRVRVTDLKELLEEVREEIDTSFSSTSSYEPELEVSIETKLIKSLGNLTRTIPFRTTEECRQTLFELGEALGEKEKRMTRKRKISVEPLPHMENDSANLNMSTNQQPETNLDNGVHGNLVDYRKIVKLEKNLDNSSETMTGLSHNFVAENEHRIRNTLVVIKKEMDDDPNRKAYKSEYEQIDRTRFRIISANFHNPDVGFAGRLRVELLSRGQLRKIKPLELLLPTDFLRKNASIANRAFDKMEPVVAATFRARLNNLPKKYSLVDILNAWEMSVSPMKRPIPSTEQLVLKMEV